MTAETIVKKALKKTSVKARVSMISDNLALARQGVMEKVPVLELDSRIISHSQLIRLDQSILLFKTAGIGSAAEQDPDRTS
ncbi:MAG: hypothetical protein HUK40_00795 [Desulfobacter sp.]|nr:hypothetical protein [Desulfobacter sp.]WDP85641.1 MAG: hypothetical protein HUN05_11280 [Desulfobacter sp.]